MNIALLPTMREARMSESRRCCWCNSPIIRKDGEKPGQFAKRNSCDHRCAMLANWSTRKSRFASKSCVICGSVFNRNHQERTARYQIRQTCSFNCKQALVIRNRESKRALPDQWCVVCGVLLERRSDEAPAFFIKRKTCGQECHHTLISMQRVRHNADIRATPYPPDFTDGLKARIRDRDGYVCQWCGLPELTTAHHIHHIDYQKEHCDEDNLITLCRSCHPKTTFGDRDEWTRRLRAILLERTLAA